MTTFAWLTPLALFVFFTGVILFQENIRQRALARHERELLESAQRINAIQTNKGGRNTGGNYE